MLDIYYNCKIRCVKAKTKFERLPPFRYCVKAKLCKESSNSPLSPQIPHFTSHHCSSPPPFADRQRHPLLLITPLSLWKKKSSFPEVVVFVPSTRIPVQSDIQRVLKGVVPQDLTDKFTSLRNQIVLVAEGTGGSAIAELRLALNEYLFVLIGLTKKEYGLEGLIEFKWKNLEDGRQDISIANTWFEVLSAVHLLSMLTLSEAGFRVVSSGFVSIHIRF